MLTLEVNLHGKSTLQQFARFFAPARLFDLLSHPTIFKKDAGFVGCIYEAKCHANPLFQAICLKVPTSFGTIFHKISLWNDRIIKIA